jgi:hypothetical protein
MTRRLQRAIRAVLDSAEITIERIGGIVDASEDAATSPEARHEAGEVAARLRRLSELASLAATILDARASETTRASA